MGNMTESFDVALVMRVEAYSRDNSPPVLERYTKKLN
jgi:hypothetical protein